MSDIKHCIIDEETKARLYGIENELKTKNLIKLYELNLISPQKLIEQITKYVGPSYYGLEELEEELKQME